jgi:parallel beta-helix repeat protein
MHHIRRARELIKRRITTSRSVSCLILALLLTSILMLASNATWARAYVPTIDENLATSANPSTTSYVVLHQDFDNEVTASVPKNWSLTNPPYGYMRVDDTVYYGDYGKSAKFVDNSTKGSPGAYRNFTEQRGTIVVSLAVRLVSNVGNNTGLEVRVDDGTFAGANIIFGNGSIQYRSQYNQLITLRTSYVANRWYNIKFIMDIPDNLYNIHIDEHLGVANAKFTRPCNQIRRIVINETSNSRGMLLPIGYIDNVEVRKGIVIPTDFPTIQEGIDAASPGDVVIVSKNRTYFENITIWKNVWLVGQNSSTTIIDGRFAKAAPNLLTVLNCSDVQIYGFTIRYSAAGGAQVYLTGSGNIIANNIIESGLGDAIRILGSGNIVTNNTAKSNLGCGINVVGSNSTIRGNVIESNDGCGIQICGSNSTIADNVIMSNGQFGIQIMEARNSLVVNNTIQENEVGLKLETSTCHSKIYQNRFVGNTRQAADVGVANKWDDGYPYNLMRETGGGNYWSDYNGTDLYKGPSQNERGDYGMLSPDGIGDQPYNIAPNSIDHYPLFLIQSVAQNPTINKIDYNSDITTGNIDYTTWVTITSRVLIHTQVSKAILYVIIDGTKLSVIPFLASGSILTATIPPQPYSATVGYIVSVLAYKANWLNSTSYPIPFPYFVRDWTPPNVDGIIVNPNNPNENQTITIYAVVTEPPGASGVANVFVTYKVGSTSWTAEMTKIGPSSNNYTAIIPTQPLRSTLNFNITAVDEAGNWATPTNSSTRARYIKQLARLQVKYEGNPTEPCSIGLDTVSGDRAKSNIFTIENNNTPRDASLNWGITVVMGGPWLTYLNPTSGLLPGGGSVNVTITIDTSKCPDPSLYVVELSVKANGTVPQWAVIESFTVRYIVIDQSWASCEAPNRCDVGVTQHYAFHAKWANNCSDAIGGSITIFCKVEGTTKSYDVNGTGWVNFPDNSQNVISKTFTVEKVQFRDITAFRQRAPDRTTIWDRVYVSLSLANNWIDVGSMANIFGNGSYYEYDQSTFDGIPLFNPPPIHYTRGRYAINASFIIDNKYNLTAFESNTVWCTWDEIEIILGGVSRSQLNAGQMGTVWFTAIYSYTNKLFKGTDGNLYVNDTPLIWLTDKEVWAENCSYTTLGTRTFTVTGVEDVVHNLTKIKDNVGPLNITWGPTQVPWWQVWWPPSSGNPAKSQSSPSESQTAQSAGAKFYQIWPLLIIMLAGGIGIAIPLVLLMKSGKKLPKIATGNKRPKIATGSSRH